MRPLNHDEAVLLGILSKMPARFVLRTMMVKLTYMLDVYACEHTGSQITSFTYSWDNYGPNDQSNSIVKNLDRLADDGYISHEQFDNVYGDVSHLYGLEGRQYVLDLTEDDWVLIEHIVDRLGCRSLSEVVAASKHTAPMKGVRQGDTLTLKPNPDIAQFRKTLAERYGDFIEESLRESAEIADDLGLTSKQMEAEIGQRTSIDRSS